jgi:LacI family transcriptional regulator
VRNERGKLRPETRDRVLAAVRRLGFHPNDLVQSLLTTGAYGLAAEHLLGAGRRCLAHLTGPQHFQAVRLRAGAYGRTAAEAGYPIAGDHLLSGPWDEKWAYEATVSLLDRNSHIDGIFCGSDLLARGTVDALREHGICVPDDVAVVGFDNWEIVAANTRPPLTTVDMNLHALGRLAGERLLAMIDGKRTTGTICAPCTLVVRSTCGFRVPGSAATEVDAHQFGAIEINP